MEATGGKYGLIKMYSEIMHDTHALLRLGTCWWNLLVEPSCALSLSTYHCMGCVSLQYSDGGFLQLQC